MPVRVQVFEALIIRSAQSPHGSLGTYQYMDALMEATLLNARRLAPIGDPLDRLHDEKYVGFYQASFRADRLGSNGHRVRRTIYNMAPYASVVEKGRHSTRGKTRETFSTRHRPGAIVTTAGTWGWSGQNVLNNALAEAHHASHLIAPMTFANAVGIDYPMRRLLP